MDTLEWTATNIQINPYIQIQSSNRISQADIHNKIDADFIDQKKLLQDGQLTVNIDNLQEINLQKYTVTLLSESSYQDLWDLVDEEMYTLTRDLKIKNSKRSLPEVIELLDASTKQLDTRIADWKELLNQYLQKKYGDDSDTFVDELEELDILK